MIVFAYYGSLTRFDGPVMSKADVAKKLRMAPSTVSLNIKRFIAGGHSFDAMQAKKKSFTKVPARLKRTLLSTKLLQEWGAFSMPERVQIIERVWDYPTNVSFLARFYKAHGIRYRRVKEVYSRALRLKDTLDRERQLFASVLGNILAARKVVIYMDETTFTSRIVKRKTWQRADQPNLMHFGDQWMSQTVYGAISSHLREPVWYLGKSTNATDFCRFLDKIRGQLRYHREKPVLLYDGASAHTAARSQHKLSLHFKGLKMPPYSSEFNSIEHVWAAAKSNFVKLCLVNDQPMTRTRFE